MPVDILPRLMNPSGHAQAANSVEDSDDLCFDMQVRPFSNSVISCGRVLPGFEAKLTRSHTLMGPFHVLEVFFSGSSVGTLVGTEVGSK